MTEATANKVFDLLVIGAEAPESQRLDFVYEMVKPQEDRIREWRFSGNLGYGGKYWPLTNDVTCYPEDETKDRKSIVTKLNKALYALRESVNEPEW